MTRELEETKPKQFRLPKSDRTAIQELAKAGHVIGNPDSLKDLTEVGAVRQALRDAWSVAFPNKPYPGESE